MKLTHADITRQALKVLENNLKAFPIPPVENYYTPTPVQRLKWRLSGYFTNLWDALCGRRNYD